MKNILRDGNSSLILDRRKFSSQVQAKIKIDQDLGHLEQP